MAIITISYLDVMEHLNIDEFTQRLQALGAVLTRAVEAGELTESESYAISGIVGLAWANGLPVPQEYQGYLVENNTDKKL